MIKKIYFILISLIALYSCATPINPYAQKYLGSERIFEKNYTVGVKKHSYVGEPMVRVRDYLISKSTSTEVIASSNSNITMGGNTWPIEKDKIYKVVGEVNLKNKNYRVIGVTNQEGVLINDDGRINPDYVAVIQQVVSTVWSINSTNDLKFIDVKETNIVPSPGHINYELIYSGRNSESIFIKYREYTTQDLARDSFFQDLTYSISSKKIRFKNIEILIDNVDDEKIVFTVISDGILNQSIK